VYNVKEVLSAFMVVKKQNVRTVEVAVFVSMGVKEGTANSVEVAVFVSMGEKYEDAKNVKSRSARDTKH